MLDFIKDIIDSFRQSSLERVKSPFLGAFVFSWIAFNWQPHIILVFSENKIEKRLGVINDHYDIGSFLLGPICTAMLITFLLPQINKIITKLQDKPNSDTIELTLTSKIRVAELQQSIAEIEAKKKLADKKEEKYIEESIYRIKEENEKLNEQLLSADLTITDLNSKLSEAIIDANNYKSLLNAEKETRSKAEQSVSKLSDANISLNTQIRELDVKISSSDSVMSSLLKERDIYLTQIEKFKEKLNSYQDKLNNLKLDYPSIFHGRIIDGYYDIEISEQAEQKLQELNQYLSVNSFKEKFDSNNNLNLKGTHSN
jgi:chromosome segregation ATPase